VTNHRARTLGAVYLEGDRWRFTVWAPFSPRVELVLEKEAGDRAVEMDPRDDGYHAASVDGLSERARYWLRLEPGSLLADPASLWQPEGVRGPSALVNSSAWDWSDQGWNGVPLQDLVIYELHVGTFTREGTFDAVIPRLDELRELGVTAIELMPVGQFPGSRNWGYDGAFPYAAQDSYGGPAGFQRLVDACHARGLAVVLDVVYNHVGPEGNHLAELGPYFTQSYRTPWGRGLNFDGPGSDHVRRYFIENAVFWLDDLHVDALRVDAIHGIVDMTARPFLLELVEAVDDLAAKSGRKLHLIAESHLGDARVVRPRELGGLGFAAQWTDDFHHALHAALTNERAGYYADFGSLAHLAKAFTHGFVYTGQFSRYWGRRHGSSTAGLPATRFVVYAQNHDQVGNRALGERLSTLVGFEELKLVAGVLLLSPFVPLFFMGEEYGEESPFHYFVSHSDPDLVESVRAGRREEFAAFAWAEEPPDLRDEQTFLRSKLSPDRRHEGRHDLLWRLYRELLLLRRERPSLANLSKTDVAAWPDEEARLLLVVRCSVLEEALLLFHFGDRPADVDVPFAGLPWGRVLDSSDRAWGGPGTRSRQEVDVEADGRVSLQPQSFVLYTRERR
jgi:maltooligosyltrehalose trehalohydrolase